MRCWSSSARCPGGSQVDLEVRVGYATHRIYNPSKAASPEPWDEVRLRSYNGPSIRSFRWRR